MAEGRMIKKNISCSDKLASLKSDSSRMLYLFILPHLDIEGRHSADPDIIKGHILTKLKSWTNSKIEQHLKELENVGLLTLYEIDGEKYLEYINFKKYQLLRPDKEAESKIPAPLPNKDGSSTGVVRGKVEVEVEVEVKDKYIYNSINFLKNISTNEKDVKELMDKYSISRKCVLDRAEDVIDYCASKGKTYKDYKATLRNFIKSHIQRHPDCIIVKKDAPKIEVDTRTPEEKAKDRARRDAILAEAHKMVKKL